MKTIRLNLHNSLVKNGVSIVKRNPRPGNYLLKDGRVSEETVFAQEKGVFLEESVWVPVASLVPGEKKFSAVQAVAFCLEQGLRLPMLGELFPLLEYSKRNVFNNALSAIGKYSCSVTSDPLSSCWYQEVLFDKAAGERSLLAVPASLSVKESSEAMVIGSGVCVVSGSGKGLIRGCDGNYYEGSWSAWPLEKGEEVLLSPGLRFLLLEGRYLFAVYGGCLSYMDEHPRYNKELGIIFGEHEMYQVLGNNLCWMQPSRHSSVCEFEQCDDGKLVIHCSDESYFGGGRNFGGEFTDVYTRDADGFYHREE